MQQRSLTVYFSWSENTRYIAETIQSQVGGDLLRLETLSEYPLDYYACVEVGRVQVREKQTPTLKPVSLDMTQYNRIFLGSPVWCGSFAPAIRSFLAENDLSGKNVYPFCTHGGGGQKNFTEDLKKLCGRARLMDTLVLHGSGEPQLRENLVKWISRSDR